ncbi:MAG: hypothetical protein KDB22_19315 [Planctomycetales bacterium]|nr:hypothetical protein [Planctomycetales bacterium]
MSVRDRRDSASTSSNASGRRRWRIRLTLFFIVTALLILFLPTIATQRSIVLGLANRFAGVAPLEINIKSVKAGWFAPISIQDLQLLDPEGRVIAKVGNIATEKGVLAWLLNRSDLGLVRIERAECVVIAQHGTTNIEKHLSHLMSAESSDATTPDSGSALPMSGRIEITDSKLLLMEGASKDGWIVQVTNAAMQLPGAGQTIGPTEMHALIGDATTGQVAGEIRAALSQADQSESLSMTAELRDLPLGLWRVIRARLPEIPVQGLGGSVSAAVQCDIASSEHWQIDIQRFESQGLHVEAPTLLGSEPANLSVLAAAGKVSLTSSALQVENAKLQCDFANVAFNGSCPWPIAIPSLEHPTIADGKFDVRGTIDLAKLTKSAATLVPMRSDAQLQAGQAQFIAAQTTGTNDEATIRVYVQLAGLKAQTDSKTIAWQQPLSVDVQLAQSDHGPRFTAAASAEFCSLQGKGTITEGNVAANLNLDKLHQRLGDWIELPVTSMTGSTEIDLNWTLVGNNTIQAKGNLKTTPLEIAFAGAATHQEPAWNGSISAALDLNNNVPTQLNRAQLALKSSNDQLTIDLQEPVQLTTYAPVAVALPPAKFSLSLSGDLAKWNRRGVMWMSEPPTVAVAGNAQIAVNGMMDLSHVEITGANWRCEPLTVLTADMDFTEPLMIGNFQGLVNTNDFGALAVNDLKLQMSSIALAARDAAVGDSLGSRKGQAGFQVDLGRLTSNFKYHETAAGTLPDNQPASTTVTTGVMRGELAWQVNSQAASLTLGANGENFVLASFDQRTQISTPFWNEPSMNVTLNGRWLSGDNSANIENLQVKTPWLTYSGELKYNPGTAPGETSPPAIDAIAAGKPSVEQGVLMSGQVVYDSEALAKKLQPYTGGQLQLFGQQTVPIQLEWQIGDSSDASLLSGLNATTRVGWQRARVAGIDVGTADVPVLVQAGQLTSATEIPVSGGVLRWDIASDLTADNLIIQQKPMRVLENVAITDEMCKGWLKYVAPLLAEATRVDGRLSLTLAKAELTPANPAAQSVAGQLNIHGAQVGPGPLSNSLIAMVQQVEKIRKNDYTSTVASQHVWLNVSEQQVNFEMQDGRVRHNNLNVRIGDTSVSTAGSVAIDGQMDLLATVPIPDKWVETSPLLAGMRGQSLQFPMRGTLSNPQVDTRLLQQFSQQTVQNAAQGLLQQQLSKGLGKLFGQAPLPNPSTPPISGN